MTNDTNTNNPVSQKGNTVNIQNIRRLHKLMTHPTDTVRADAKAQLEAIAYGDNPYARNDVKIVNAARMALVGDLEAALKPMPMKV